MTSVALASYVAVWMQFGRLKVGAKGAAEVIENEVGGPIPRGWSMSAGVCTLLPVGHDDDGSE
jgi:hypothetical protein